MDTTQNTKRSLDANTTALMQAAGLPIDASGGKATLYFQSDMGLGIRRVEVRSWRVEVRPYAQHRAAVEVTFIPKGARTGRRLIQAYDPTVVIVEGHNTPSPDGIYDESTTTVSADGAASSTRGRYSACDPRWARDFDAKLAEIPPARILVNYRKGGPFQRPF